MNIIAWAGRRPRTATRFHCRNRPVLQPALFFYLRHHNNKNGNSTVFNVRRLFITFSPSFLRFLRFPCGRPKSARMKESPKGLPFRVSRPSGFFIKRTRAQSFPTRHTSSLKKKKCGRTKQNQNHNFSGLRKPDRVNDV